MNAMRKAIQILLALYGGLALAQSAPPKQLPNETDLKAAYCMPFAATLTYSDNHFRLEAYLVPRLKFLDSVGILAASERGKADVVRARQDNQRCEDSCKAPPNAPNGCWTKCLENSEALMRTATCADLSFLPF